MMFALAISFCLISTCQNPVSAHNVLDWTSHYQSNQLAFPQQRKAKTISSVTTDLTSPSGQSLYKVKCEIYEEEDPKADIFTKDGVFIDTLTLATIETPCDKLFLKNHILPRDPENGKVKVIYLWSGKMPNCVERTYDVHEYPFMASVTKSSYPRVACPEKVTKFLKTYRDMKKAGGIVNVGPRGKTDVMDFNANVLTQGTLKYLDFPKINPKDKVFKLICREDTLMSEDPITKRSTIMTGSIVHENNIEIVLEKFKLNSCDTNHINVNRRIINDVNYFKVVFKTAEGKCYEREYEYLGVDYLYYYNQITLLRYWPKQVNCPEKFVGDIDINAWQPLHKRILLKVLRRRKPYSVELRINQIKN